MFEFFNFLKCRKRSFRKYSNMPRGKPVITMRGDGKVDVTYVDDIEIPEDVRYERGMKL